MSNNKYFEKYQNTSMSKLENPNMLPITSVVPACLCSCDHDHSRYRCNQEAEMEGRDTVACTGTQWNGSVPSCNGEQYR